MAGFAALLALGVVLDVAWLVGGPEDVLPFALALLVVEVPAFLLALILLWRGRSLAGSPAAGPGEPVAGTLSSR